MNTREFIFVFVSGQHAAMAEHTLDLADMDCLPCGPQGAQGSTGPNYQPWRVWSEETMVEHEEAIRTPRRSVHTARVVNLRAKALPLPLRRDA